MLKKFQVLKNFLETVETEVRSLLSLYSEVVSALYSQVYRFLHIYEPAF